jgi:hypothetical protein
MCEFDTAQTYSIALQLDTVPRNEFVEFRCTLASDVTMVSPFVDHLSNGTREFLGSIKSAYM